VPKAYQDVHGVDPQIFDIANGMTDFARRGYWHAALDTACAVVSRYWKVRDAIETPVPSELRLPGRPAETIPAGTCRFTRPLT